MGLQKLLTNLSEGVQDYPNHNLPTDGGGFNYGESRTPVFEGQFRQKSFKFGEGTAFDRPGGEFSSQPFVTSERINTNIVDSFTDGLVRGGIVTATARSIKDVERITKFLLTPQGLGFLTKQVGLQKSNPVIFDNNNDQRTYNLGLNTLASIASSATGIRFKREGSLPISNPDNFDGYSRFGLFQDIEDNRLVKLFKGHISLEETPDSPFKLFEYNGGPKSIYGIGKTHINKYTHPYTPDNYGNDPNILFNFTTNISEPISALSSEGKSILIKPFDLRPAFKDSNGNQIDIGGKYGEGFSITNFRSMDDDITQNTPSFKTRESYGEKKQGIGLQSPLDFRKLPGSSLSHDPSIEAARKKQTSKYTTGITSYHVSYNGESDAVNLKDIQQDLPSYDEDDDFIPFRFEAVRTNNPLNSDYIIFRAFLDSFNDNYNANHNEFNYNGRGESFYTYQNFTREINFSFKIAAQSQEEIKPLYTKLNYLVSNTAPEYGETALGGRMRTPYMKITVGDWCNKLPGVLSGVQLSWQKDYPWQIKNSENILMLPHVLDVTVNFIPIHNFLPEKSINSQFFNLKEADA